MSSKRETNEHTIYTLVAKEGIGNSPSKADSIYLSYEGILLDKTLTGIDLLLLNFPFEKT